MVALWCFLVFGIGGFAIGALRGLVFVWGVYIDWRGGSVSFKWCCGA